jgi:hypothetical protein
MTQDLSPAAILPEDAAGLVTHLMDAAEPPLGPQNGLCVGHPVLLRSRPDGRAVEAWSQQLGRLGSLPRDAADALAPLLAAGIAAWPARVSALVPRPGRLGGTRIHICLGAPG